MKVLYIGGSGEISHACVTASVLAGHRVAVFNRGQRDNGSPDGVERIIGDIADDAAYASLAIRRFDVVCQFLAFEPDTVKRDIAVFGGQCAQYIFVSSASAYQKPNPTHLLTEDVPLDNPYWAYSRSKAACESVLTTAHEAGTLPVTIVRPSHTYRTRLPSTVIDGDHLVWRIRQNKPIVVHGDGESLWTLTHADDFARAFVHLCANDRALGETCHITDSKPHTWNTIIRGVAGLLEREATLCHVATDTLVRYQPDWTGPLLGDKANNMTFDNRRISAMIDGWRCEINFAEGLRQTLPFVEQRMGPDFQPDKATDALVDQIVSDQNALGL